MAFGGTWPITGSRECRASTMDEGTRGRQGGKEAVRLQRKCVVIMHFFPATWTTLIYGFARGMFLRAYIKKKLYRIECRATPVVSHFRSAHTNSIHTTSHCALVHTICWAFFPFPSSTLRDFYLWLSLIRRALSESFSVVLRRSFVSI